MWPVFTCLRAESIAELVIMLNTEIFVILWRKTNYYYYYYYKWVLLWWRCRITAAGPPYNVTVTFRRRNSNHNISPQLFSRNTKRVNCVFLKSPEIITRDHVAVKVTDATVIGSSSSLAYYFIVMSSEVGRWFTYLHNVLVQSLFAGV